MKNIYAAILRHRKNCIAICLVFCLSLLLCPSSLAQCQNNNSFYTDMTPASVGQTVSNSCVFAGEYVTVSVCAGASYTFETCGSSFDTELTLRENTVPFSVLDHNDDACGVQSSITWVATYTGLVRVLLDRYPCTHANACHVLAVTWNTGCGAMGGAGDDCASAIPVSCGTSYANQSSLGNGNTTSGWTCTTLNTPGEDRYYALTVTDPSATVVRLTLANVVDTDTYLEVIQAGTACTGTACNLLAQFDIAAGTFNGTGLNSFDFPVTGAGIWYFIVDSQGDGVSSFDIGFECLSSGILFDTSGCAGPPADTDMNGYEVSWNGGATGPVQHNDVGTICFTLYIQNPSSSGFEWLKEVNFSFGDCWTDVQNLTPTGPPNGNGIFNALGTWNGAYSSVLNEAQFVFSHSTNPVWGDGNAAGMTCAQYTFCMQARVDTTLCTVSSESGLDIVIFAEDDGIGGFGSTQPSSILVLTDELYIDTSLPVELATFEAWVDGEMARLEWVTASETNNDHFRVERSAEGDGFITVGTMPGMGTSQALTSYKFEDAEPLLGENYYRLVQVDRDGAEMVVGQQVLFFAGKDGFGMLSYGPNPVQDEIQLHVSASEDQKMRLQVRDQSGRLIYTRENDLHPGKNKLRLETETWAAGLYLVRMESGGQQETFKFLKTK